MSMSLKEQIKSDLKFPESYFSSHETALYVKEAPGIWIWLIANYDFWKTCQRFYGTDKQWWIDIPFAFSNRNFTKEREQIICNQQLKKTENDGRSD